MRLRPSKANVRSHAIFENLVDKSIGEKQLSFENSVRCPKSGKRETEKQKAQKPNDFLSNLPELMRIELAASVLGLSTKTIYDWRYRCKQRKIPVALFVKVNRLLLVRTSVLKEWIASQNPSLQSERI